MNSNLTKEWVVAAIFRAIRTVAQTALSMLTIGMGLFDVNWIQLLSISLMAGIISVLTSVVTGLPEAKTEGMMIVNPDIDEEGVVVGLKLDKEVTPELANELLSKGVVNLRVRK